MKEWKSTQTVMPAEDQPVWCYDTATGEMWMGGAVDQKKRWGYGEFIFYYEVTDLHRKQDGELSWGEIDDSRVPTHWIEVEVPMLPSGT